MTKLLVLDNYDSFTFNLVQELGALGAEPLVFRNDALTVEQAMALDVAAVLGAHAFSPAPRSGLSVHYTAMRRCDAGALCDPAYAACVPYASSGCGGAFPRTILHDPPRCSLNRARGRYAGEPLCMDAQGVERPMMA
jgi:hypothetical protein